MRQTIRITRIYCDSGICPSSKWRNQIETGSRIQADTISSMGPLGLSKTCARQLEFRAFGVIPVFVLFPKRRNHLAIGSRIQTDTVFFNKTLRPTKTCARRLDLRAFRVSPVFVFLVWQNHHEKGSRIQSDTIFITRALRPTKCMREAT